MASALERHAELFVEARPRRQSLETERDAVLARGLLDELDRWRGNLVAYAIAREDRDFETGRHDF